MLRDNVNLADAAVTKLELSRQNMTISFSQVKSGARVPFFLNRNAPFFCFILLTNKVLIWFCDTKIK